MTLSQQNHDLGTYAGDEVIGTAIKIKGAGDGLSAPLAIDPVIYPIGTRLFVVNEVVVAAHTHKEKHEKGERLGVMLIQELRAEDAAVIDRDLVVKVFEEQRARVKEASDNQATIENEIKAREAEAAEAAAAEQEALDAANRAKDEGAAETAGVTPIGKRRGKAADA